MNNFVIAQNVIKKIEELVEQHDLDYIDAALYYANSAGLEIEALAEIISANEPFKYQIQIEAEDLHFLKRTKRLPL